MFKIHPLTYILLFIAFLCGTFRNLLIIYIIVIVHELGHVMISYYLKFKIKEILILPFGGITKLDKCVNTSTDNELLLALGGILNQLILFIILFILFRLNILSYKTYGLFKYYNIILILFNLIPVIPLDGYSILKAILEKFLPFKKSFYITVAISIIILLVLIFLNYYYAINNYLILSFIIYKIIIEVKDFKFVYHKFLLERYFNNLTFRRVKILNKIKLDKMHKDKYHFFISDGNIHSESKILNKLFDKSHIYW